MRARERDEEHRVSSPLELLFDLTFVVAISSLAAQLAEKILAGHAASAIPGYLMVFFAVWWAWMNFTWFASGFDTDDAIYRVFTLVQMAGVLVLAASVPQALDTGDFLGVVIGYLIMRVGLVAHWLRAAIEHPESRLTALRYAGGISLVQLGWVLRLVLPPDVGVASFILLAVLDMTVPIWADRRSKTMSWHPGHIAERYGLFVIILLGESVAAATVAMQRALASGLTASLVVVGAAGLLLLFAIWWVYYLEPAERGLAERPQFAYFWGYGHWFLFAAIAAVGAGLDVSVDAAAHVAEIGSVAVGYALALPVAVLFVLLYVVHRPLVDVAEVPGFVVLPAAALEVLAPLAAPALGVAATVVVIAAVAALVVVATVLVHRQRSVGSISEPASAS
jgi:low temperature requirement protein LtrA